MTTDTVPTVERTVENRDEVEEEDFVVVTKRITEDDVTSFGRVTGDENRLHLDEEYAGETRFKGRIAHGVLGMGLMSAAMAQLPGTPIIDEWLKTPFKAPIPIGDVIRAEAVVEEELGSNYYVIDLYLRDRDDKVLVEGAAKVLLDPEPGV